MTGQNPTTRIRFHGVAAYEIVTRNGTRILCDPFLEGNPAAPVKYDGFDKVDLVVVSHAAYDHLGDADRIALHYGCPVVCGGEVKAWLVDRGVPDAQIHPTTWGIRVDVAGVRILPLECHHWSQIRLKDGSFISGVPIAFIVYADENVRFYHYGDTALFSDLKLHGELYRPTVGAVGIASPREIMQNLPVPGGNCDRQDKKRRRAQQRIAREERRVCGLGRVEHRQHSKDHRRGEPDPLVLPQMAQRGPEAGCREGRVSHHQISGIAVVSEKEKGAQISRRILRRADRNTGAAFGRQESDKTMHLGKIDPVEHLTALLVLQNQPGIDQRRKVMRQRRRGETQMLADIADPQPVVPGLHQQAKDRKTRIVAESGKGAGIGAGRGHESKITTILVL